ncbi:MAG TPA: RNase adapter RapZ [Polyangia bacterium]|jgi:RNase adapter protein RapZ|nr:RNase adapter RapZ [Polyangia bacterium]
MRLVVVTGVSGAGKSTALRTLEDLGFYAVDNLPLPLVPKLIELLASRADIDRAALGLDARGGSFLAGASSLFADLRRAGNTVEVLFLDASDEILIRRFSETRRRHPLSDTDIRTGVAAERQGLAALRQEADALVDTGALTVHVLRALIQERYGRGEGDLGVTLLSFGFKHGIPAESDIVLDVRFLPNPFFVPHLSALSGEDESVARFVLDDPAAKAFVDEAEKLMRLSVAGFQREGKSYATVAIGCTGGRHRSVTIAKELGRRLGGEFPLSIRHRDIQRGSSD